MRTRLLSILLYIVSMVTLLGLPLAACTQAPAPTETATTPQTVTVAATPLVIPILVNMIAPSVVRVITDEGMGSGIVIDKQGFVLTNSHVVEGSQSMTVVLADKREYPASVVGRDEIKDLAVLKISATNLSMATLGNSEKLSLGDEVIAIGYPLDLTGSATISRGIVSAFRIDNESGLTYIQTDASINPGSSGGALINSTGEVVGIVVSTIRVADGLPIQGMNFAIAIDSAKPSIPRLLAGESILKPLTWLTYTDAADGYSIQYPITWERYRTLGLPYSVMTFSGPPLSLASVNVNSIKPAGNAPLSSALDSLLHKSELLSRRDLMWQGIYPAIEFTYLNNLVPTTQRKQLVTRRGNSIYIVEAAASQSEYDTYSSTFDFIIDSFRLTN